MAAGMILFFFVPFVLLAFYPESAFLRAINERSGYFLLHVLVSSGVGMVLGLLLFPNDKH